MLLPLPRPEAPAPAEPCWNLCGELRCPSSRLPTAATAHQIVTQMSHVGGGNRGCPLASGKSLRGLPASLWRLPLLPCFLAPEPTPSPARSHLFPGPTYSFLSTFLPQHLLPRPSLGLSAAQISPVRNVPLVPHPTPDLATSPSCRHPTAQDPSKLASPTCISDFLGLLLLSTGWLQSRSATSSNLMKPASHLFVCVPLILSLLSYSTPDFKAHTVLGEDCDA